MDNLTHLKTALEQAEALIFDMDGTLIDSMPSHYEAWSRVARNYDLHFSRERFYQLGGVPTYETLEILSAESGLEINIPEAKAMKEKLYDDLTHLVGPIATSVAIVEAYHGKKPMAIATGASRRNQ
ncbi:MAG: HAD hydrolase-like protein [Reinekea sp.]